MMRWHLQGFRFVLVGIISNLVLFALYLLLTSFGIGPKIAMTGLFALGVIQTFIFNKKWTFNHLGMGESIFCKYMVVYGLTYLINIFALLVLVDKLKYPHQIVQAVMIVCLALLLFVLQKFWVFRSR